ncbi:MAG: crotonase [Myxococcales bacterium]|nr:MAG: crotonase [Myxococcales bacterium]
MASVTVGERKEILRGEEASMDEVLYQKTNATATITINRPSRRNTLTSSVVNALRAHLARTNSDPEVRVVILTGAGDTVFCAGGDLGRDASDSGAIARYDANREMADLLRDIRALAKPLIARVNGHALGSGFALVLACDLAVAVQDVRLGCPDMKVGIFPMLTLAHLNRHLGPKKALELLLTAKQITAAEAVRLGLVNDAVAREDLDLKITELATPILEFSPVAVRLGREAVAVSADMGFDDGLNYLLAQLTLNLQTDDAKEGAQAFLQKRKATWTGH